MEHNNTIRQIRIGISSCLLGEKVRFDSGHKHDRYLTDVFGKYVDWVSVCPEVEVGMGVPRESVRLVGDPVHPRMIGVKSAKDWTEPMVGFSEKRVKELNSLELSGYIFKSDSPSCGMERVKIYGSNGMSLKTGRGMFADVFMKYFPLIPVEEEGRLNDERLRENFIVRLFAYHRLQNLARSGFTVGELVKFHTIHKYLMLAHSPKHYEMLGRLVATAKSISRATLRDDYSKLFMEGLAVKATTKKNVNVLHHILGFLKERLSADEKKDILGTIEEYYSGLIPLVVPLTLLRHYIRKYQCTYITDQIYLNPHPKELMLRNRV
jgi:uncharacterized protein YbgA (DUF1722 family)/uncharacterized protein YbbK (DUF523 family)